MLIPCPLYFLPSFALTSDRFDWYATEIQVRPSPAQTLPHLQPLRALGCITPFLRPCNSMAEQSDFAPGTERGHLVPGVSTIEGSITDALVLKNGNLFFISQSDASVPVTGGHGFGLYYQDCRFLNGYELTISGRKPEV